MYSLEYLGLCKKLFRHNRNKVDWVPASIVCQVLELVFKCILLLSSASALVSKDFLSLVTYIFCYTC